MSNVSPFAGLVYDLSVVGSLEGVTSPPYDVISDEEQQRLRRSSSYNVVHLEFNEKHPEAAGREDQYRQAASTLQAWRDEGALLLDDDPAYYPYELGFADATGQRRIRGLICEVSLEEWGGSIIPHERTIQRQVDDRLGLLREVKANLSPVYALFAGPVSPLRNLLAGLKEPERAMVDEAGVRHSLWRLRDDRIAGWLASEALLIADGHHRYTVALQYRAEMRAHFGPGPWDRIMMFIADASSEDPPVLPIHRLVVGASMDLEGSIQGTELEGLEDVLSSVSDDSLVCGVATAHAGKMIFESFRLDGEPPAVRALHQHLLDRPELEGHLQFTHDANHAAAQVSSGESSAAFFLPSTTAARIRGVIDRGERLPQKSTFFWPKPRTGLVIRSIG